MTAMSKVAPLSFAWGFAWLIGKVSLPHSSVASSGHGANLIEGAEACRTAAALRTENGDFAELSLVWVFP
jgi:hypothetical protein